MNKKMKAVYYINQFYAGIGGEDKADQGLIVYHEAKGPGTKLNEIWQGELEIVKTIVCGDNFINRAQDYDSVKDEIIETIRNSEADVLIAGPAFNAGRYGTACAKICDLAKNQLQIPAVTAMWKENPAIKMYVKNNYILPSTETAAGMRKTLPHLASFSLKLAKGLKIGGAKEEGYFPTGHRYNEYHQETGAKRVVDMLLSKLYQTSFDTEVPLRGFENIQAAPKITNMSDAKIALITTGGLVPKGNPDHLKQAFSVTYGSYEIGNKETLKKDYYESIHGGYDTTDVNQDPHRLIPLDGLQALLKNHKIKGIYHKFLTTCGIGTNIESSNHIGAQMAKELNEAQIQGAILTTT